MIYKTSLKWFQTMKVAWADLFVYKANFLLTIIGPLAVFFIIKYNLWYSIYDGSETKELQGFTLSKMISYHIWIMIISMIAFSFNSQHLSEDIRLGRVSSYLIYPFSLWEFHASKFLSRIILQLFIALFTIAGIYFFLGETLPPLKLQSFFYGISISIWVGFFWFSAQYWIGLLAFWLDETWTILVMFQLSAQFLSGALIPLDFYPPWLVQALKYTPYPYLFYTPVKAFSGEYSTPWEAISILSFWTLIVGFLSWLTWKKGLKLYTAAGM